MRSGMFRIKWLALTLVLVMAVTAGCQAVGGLDLNGALKRSIKVESMEGKQSLEFELMLSDEQEKELAAGLKDGDGTAQWIDLFRQIKLDLTDIKMKDARTVSLKGTLALGDVKIGFGVRMAGALTVVELEGAKRPIVLDLEEAAFRNLLAAGNPFGYNPLSPDSGEAGEPADPEAQAKLTEMAKTIMDQVAGFAVDNLPNPNGLQVLPAIERVNGEQLTLMHVAMRMNGVELWQWIKAYLDALIADREGLTEALLAVNETMLANKDIFASLGIPLEEEEALPIGLTDEEEIKKAAGDLVEKLQEMRAEMDTAEKEDADTIGEIFNKDSYLKVDLYADSKLDIRKSAAELVVKPDMASLEPESEGAGEQWDESPGLSGFDLLGPLQSIEGIRLRIASEQSNVNGSVTPDAPVKAPNGLSINEMSTMQGYETLRLFDRSSAMYGLLKKLEIGKQVVYLDPVYGDYPPVVTPEGVTIVSLRDTADKLGIRLDYDASTRSMRLRDKGKDVVITVMQGSKKAFVNGRAVQWSYPATVMPQSGMYVPARDLMKALGGTVRWETVFDEEQALVLEREME